MSAENDLRVDEEALQRANMTLIRTKKFIKAGHTPAAELVTVEADAAIHSVSHRK